MFDGTSILLDIGTVCLSSSGRPARHQLALPSEYRGSLYDAYIVIYMTLLVVLAQRYNGHCMLVMGANQCILLCSKQGEAEHNIQWHSQVQSSHSQAVFSYSQVTVRHSQIILKLQAG